VTKPTIAYFMHRYRRPNPRLNLDRAYRWLKWLVDTNPDLCIQAPWMPYCEALVDEDVYRARGIRDNKILCASSGARLGIIAGPELTSGSRGEAATLWEYGASIVDLTPLGMEEPPPLAWTDLSRVVSLTASRLAAHGQEPAYWQVTRVGAAFRSCQVHDYRGDI
jgi:hypothetical protein